MAGHGGKDENGWYHLLLDETEREELLVMLKEAQQPGTRGTRDALITRLTWGCPT